MSKPLCLQMCSFFREELAALLQEPEFADVAMGVFTADCGRPPLAESRLRSLGPDCGPETASLVIGSACLADLSTTTDAPAQTIERHANCFYPFADRTWVDGLIGAGAYLITAGWLRRWRHWLEELGFHDAAAAGTFFRGFATRLVLLDTGVFARAKAELQALAEHLDLPCESIPIGLSHFRLYVENLCLDWHRSRDREEAAEQRSRMQAELANYAMAMDLVGSLARTLDERQAIERMQDVFRMLFGAQQVEYRPQAGSETAPDQRIDTLDDGFCIHLCTDNHRYGTVWVQDLAFPQYRDRYLNLALMLAGVCALAMENARSFQAVLDSEVQVRAANVRLEQTVEDLHRAQKQLVEAEKMASLGTLVAGVAHEINTPLGIGLTAASALEERGERLGAQFRARSLKQSDLASYLDAAHEALGLIGGNLRRIGDLVASFKQVAVDRYTERRRTFHLNAYLLDIVRSLGSKARPGVVDVRIVCDEHFVIASYPGILAQILTNLLLNSLEHGFAAERRGSIEIRVEAGTEDWTLHYRDDGCGVAPEILPKLFDPFVTTDMQGHTGLGMHIVYNLVVQKLKGSVQCDSRPGEGIHCTLRFPIENREPSA